MDIDKVGWIKDSGGPNWFHRQIISVLKCGKMPKHIGIIMDGNRRFATEKNMEKIYGHFKGFEKLTETLEWCLDLGINEVTVYAFSIENFKRSHDEVDGLMNLARRKMAKLIEEREKLEKHGVCVRVLGNLKLLPPDLQKLIAEAVTITSPFNRAFLNVCLAYTSREEITSSIRTVVSGMNDGRLEASDINEKLLGECMYTGQCQPLDILVRTSGEVRLSDFLLWQASYSVLAFRNVLWPEFSRLDLYAAVFYYQRNIRSIQEIQQAHTEAASYRPSGDLDERNSSENYSNRSTGFIETTRMTNLDQLRKIHQS